MGGGSLGYANVLMELSDEFFASADWTQRVDWRALLRPHFATARRMLGVAPLRAWRLRITPCTPSQTSWAAAPPSRCEVAPVWWFFRGVGECR